MPHVLLVLCLILHATHPKKKVNCLGLKHLDICLMASTSFSAFSCPSVFPYVCNTFFHNVPVSESSWVIITDRSDIHAKWQCQKLMVKVILVKKCPNSCISGPWLQFEFTYGYEMMHKTWNGPMIYNVYRVFWSLAVLQPHLPQIMQTRINISTHNWILHICMISHVYLLANLWKFLTLFKL